MVSTDGAAAHLLPPAQESTGPGCRAPSRRSSVRQWVDELTAAVLEHHAAGFIYRSPDDTPAGEALARWATEIVPAVREAITR